MTSVRALAATLVAALVPAWGCGGSGDPADELPAGFEINAGEA